MTKTTLPSEQVRVDLNKKQAEVLHSNEKAVENNLSLNSFLEILKQRQELRKNGEQDVAPVFTKYSQVQLYLKANQSEMTEVNEELIARRKYLLIRQEERVYNQMMYGDNRNPHAEEVLSKSNQFSSFRHQLSLGVNILFSLFAAFGMMWYVARHVMMFDSSKSLIIGLFSAIILLLVEMTLFIVRAVRIEDETERKASIRAEVVAQQRSGGLVTAHFQKEDKSSSSTIRKTSAADSSKSKND